MRFIATLNSNAIAALRNGLTPNQADSRSNGIKYASWIEGINRNQRTFRTRCSSNREEDLRSPRIEHSRWCVSQNPGESRESRRSEDPIETGNNFQWSEKTSGKLQCMGIRASWKKEERGILSAKGKLSVSRRGTSRGSRRYSLIRNEPFCSSDRDDTHLFFRKKKEK